LLSLISRNSPKQLGMVSPELRVTTICRLIREFHRFLDRGDVKKGCDYQTLPNWLRSSCQISVDGPGGALADTVVASRAMR